MLEARDVNTAVDRERTLALLVMAAGGRVDPRPAERPRAAVGVPVKVVSERLGHSTVAFTMEVCQHVLPGMQREAGKEW